MKTNKCLWMLVLMLASTSSWAYGGGGSSSTKACAKPKFSDFVPAENAVAKPGSAFSFVASKNTYPNTIKVTVKEMPAAVKVTPKGDAGFQVNGTLPAAVTGPYARIAIMANAQSNCTGSGGWLVKIAE